MKPWNVLVTGSSGLIGSEAAEYFNQPGHRVTGIDYNMRREFFGPAGDTTWNRRVEGCRGYATATTLVEEMTNGKIARTHSEQALKGDHICYVSNLRKLKAHYPEWGVTRSLMAILEEMIAVERRHASSFGLV